MCRLGAIETTFCPRVRAHRAFCEAEILARAAALILRGPCDTRVLFNPLSALIAVSNALEKSKDYFNQAIDKDPSYALAYVGLANYYSVVPDYSPISNSEILPKERSAAQKAVAIDDSLAESHTSLA